MFASKQNFRRVANFSRQRHTSKGKLLASAALQRRNQAVSKCCMYSGAKKAASIGNRM